MPRLDELADVRAGRGRTGIDPDAPLLLVPFMLSDLGITLSAEGRRASQYGASPAKPGDLLVSAIARPCAALVPRELAGAEASEELFIVRMFNPAMRDDVLAFFKSHRGKAALEATRSEELVPRSSVDAIRALEVELPTVLESEPAADDAPKPEHGGDEQADTAGRSDEASGAAGTPAPAPVVQHPSEQIDGEQDAPVGDEEPTVSLPSDAEANRITDALLEGDPEDQAD